MKSKNSIDNLKCKRKLVEYSSDEETESDKKTKLGEPKKLALPLSISKMFEGLDSMDNPLQHQGRKRSFPHLRGNWASYVHVRLDPTELLELAGAAIIRELARCGLEFKPLLEFHISLSRTLPIPHHWIDPILSSLSKLADKTPYVSISFSGLKLLSNEDSTRIFAALEVDLGEARLKSLVSDIDIILAGYKLPKFYRPISLHASIAWGIGDAKVEKVGSALSRVWSRDLSGMFEGVCFDIDCLCFKTGHKLYNYPFKK